MKEFGNCNHPINVSLYIFKGVPCCLFATELFERIVDEFQTLFDSKYIVSLNSTILVANIYPLFDVPQIKTQLYFVS